ncbi:MAG: methyltransferase domain-containing protein [Ktedonobacteraceae bacterium]
MVQVTNSLANPNGAKKGDRRREFITRIREKRFVLFRSLISSLPRPLTILDVGGEQQFWETMACTDEDLKIVLYNRRPGKVSYPNFTSMAGDARDIKEFQDGEFDIVFSNSTIEHTGTFDQQRQMAKEVQRLGKRYFVQTPNRYFPIEPHFLLPFFQFLPRRLQLFYFLHFKTVWGDRSKGGYFVKNLRLLTEKELKLLFPGAKIYKEKFLGLTKSFIVYKGWQD